MIYRTSEKITERECDKVASELASILEKGEDVILDMSNTKYISSAGLRILCINFKTFRAKGFDFVIVNPSSSVLDILKVTGLDSQLLYTPEEKEKYGKKAK